MGRKRRQWNWTMTASYHIPPSVQWERYMYLLNSGNGRSATCAVLHWLCTNYNAKSYLGPCWIATCCSTFKLESTCDSVMIARVLQSLMCQRRNHEVDKVGESMDFGNMPLCVIYMASNNYVSRVCLRWLTKEEVFQPANWILHSWLSVFHRTYFSTYIFSWG